MDQQLQIPQEIRAFLDGILKDANMTLTDSMREEMIKDLYVRLDNFITGVIIDHLPDKYYDEFIKLNEEKKPQAEIEAFLKEKMPDHQKVFRDAFSQFRELYLGNIDIARAKPPEN